MSPKNSLCMRPRKCSEVSRSPGVPITAKIALLDTTFKEYQHALIGALVTTLTNESVILTISPDFTMRLTDPTLSQRIKIQVQLIGATQDAAAEQATLHHQVLYRVQDHALDRPLNFRDKGSLPPLLLLPWWVWIVRCCADLALSIFPDTD
ncbi:hypothetical protein PIB30_101105 [Stylosanthes scabra]|uniref:Uncharacterized protein n=1 Tax=Stylosanthes scabra TaxID=79078 RepID=A0ABU6XY88_9FABA|nr:hypothetical protein [Stylosanthes scabra]